MKTYIIKYFRYGFCEYEQKVQAENSTKALEKATAYQEKYKINDWIINSDFSIKITVTE